MVNCTDAPRPQQMDYSLILKDDEDLLMFIENLKQFDQHFNDFVASGKKFTLKLEVHGDQGKLVHARIYTDKLDAPVRKKKK